MTTGGKTNQAEQPFERHVFMLLYDACLCKSAQELVLVKVWTVGRSLLCLPKTETLVPYSVETVLDPLIQKY